MEILEWPLSSQLERRLWSIGKPSPRTEKCNSAAPVEAPSIPIQPEDSRPSRDRGSTKDHQEKGGGPGHFVGRAQPGRSREAPSLTRGRQVEFLRSAWICGLSPKESPKESKGESKRESKRESERESKNVQKSPKESPEESKRESKGESKREVGG